MTSTPAVPTPASRALQRSLAGFTVGITGHRRWEEQAEMLTRRGARVLHGPAMTTELLDDLDATVAATSALVAAPVDVVVLTTGIGVRSWFAAAASVGLEEDLRRACAAATIVTRGPKALAAVRSVGLDAAWTAPTETNREVLAHLAAAGVAGRRIAVQRDGGAPLLADAVRALGPGPAEVVDVPVYRWHLPGDVGPARRLLDAVVERQVDAVTFTSSYAVRSCFELGVDHAELVAAFEADVLAVTVGPVTAAAVRREGVERVVEPARARLGSMIHALSGHLEGTARTVGHGGARRRWQGTSLLADDGTTTELTRGEARMLARLIDRRPTVVAKTALLDGTADEHAAEVAVARLRAKLGPLGGGIRTVRRRGYACTLTVD